jgi:hypothetical protein
MYRANPPASGPHWSPPHPWGAFPEGVPREWWVHNLEHGGIALLFSCPGLPDAGVGGGADGGVGDGGVAWPCSELSTPLRALRDERATDKFGVVRILVTPDPLLPKRVAAAAWGWAYVADVVDQKELRCFIESRYGRGPEDAP